MKYCIQPKSVRFFLPFSSEAKLNGWTEIIVILLQYIQFRFSLNNFYGVFNLNAFHFQLFTLMHFLYDTLVDLRMHYCRPFTPTQLVLHLLREA